MVPTAHQIFPTTVWSVPLPGLEAYLPGWRTHLAAQRDTEQEGRGRSTRLGWSGPKTVFDDPAFGPLKTACHQAFSDCLAAMGVARNFPFGMEAWANIHDKGGFNQPHIHREAMLSGVFYLTVPAGSGALVFHDPRPGTLYSRPWGGGVNKWERLLFTPKMGVLVLFPHWLEHSVEPHGADEPRCSIAMNALLPSAVARARARP